MCDEQFRVISVPFRFRLPVAGHRPGEATGPAPSDEMAQEVAPRALPSADRSQDQAVVGRRRRWLWRLRGGVAVIGALLVIWWLRQPTAARALLAGFVAAGLVLSCRRVRDGIREMLHRRALRRAWELGCRRAGLTGIDDRVPAVRAIRKVPAGERFLVRFPPGRAVPELVEKAEVVARYLGVRELRVLADPTDARAAHVTLVRRDPLAGAVPLRWPSWHLQQLSLWDPLPAGVDEEGTITSLSLVGRNLLIGGETATGKSTVLSLPLAAAALDPEVDLSLLDGERVGLASLHPCAQQVAGPDLDEAIEVLRMLRADLHRRFELLLDLHKRRIEPGDGIRLHVLACDELDDYLDPAGGGQACPAGSDVQEQVREFTELISQLTHFGRAVGIIVLATVRQPSAAVLPTPLRDDFRYRCALRTATDRGSDAVLGGGWTARGATAASIPAEQRGVGYLLDVERALPTRLRFFHLGDRELSALDHRARLLRAAWTELVPAQAQLA